MAFITKYSGLIMIDFSLQSVTENPKGLEMKQTNSDKKKKKNRVTFK